MRKAASQRPGSTYPYRPSRAVGVISPHQAVSGNSIPINLKLGDRPSKVNNYQLPEWVDAVDKGSRERRSFGLEHRWIAIGEGPAVAPGAAGANPLNERNSRTRRDWRRRPDQSQRHGLEVLHDGGEVELVAGAGETAQSQPLEAMMGLEVRKAHLDALPLVT